MTRRARPWLLALAGVLTLGGGELRAQAAGDTLRLTLDEAVRIATGANPTYLQAENQLGLDGPQTRAVWLGEILPQVSFTLLSTGYSGNLARVGTDPFGNPVENPAAEWFYNSSTRQEMTVSWNLQGPSFITARRELEQARAGRRLSLSAAEANLASTIRQQFLQAVQQRALLDVEETIAETRRNDLASAERLYELARSSRLDVLNAEVQVDQQRIASQQQRRAYQQALLQLRTTMGDRDLPPLALQDPDLPIFDPSTLDEGALVERALRQNPRILEGESQVEGARVGVDNAGAYKWPSLTLQYGLSRVVQTRNADALFEVGYDPDELQSNFSVTLGVPFLNNYFQSRFSEVQAGVQLENQRESLRQTELELTAEVRSGLIDLRNQYETYRLAVRAEDVAIRATEGAREEYRLGARTFQELQQTVEQEATARRQVITSRFAFLNAVTALETAVGGPVTGQGS